MASLLNKCFLQLAAFLVVGNANAASSADVAAQIFSVDGKTEYHGEVQKTTPLGSLYKLYVLAYLLETNQNESPYQCRGENPEEIFCCSPGESIERDVALAKSCSPYFSFSRLKISDSSWKKFWKEKAPLAPAWVWDQNKMKPETVVAVGDLLSTLASIRKSLSSFDRIEKATLGTVLYGTAANSLKTWGTSLRVKTFTWRDENTKDRIDELGFTGGFAGWLQDGSAIWVSRAGYGRDAFQSELKSMVATHASKHDSGCVEVKYFDRYPIADLKLDNDKNPRQFAVTFKNGNKVSFRTDGAMLVNRKGKKIFLTSKMTTNEYVARVLDREVSPNPVDAARAFAVAIRTYLYQNSKEIDGCLQISDSSHLQRVSPAPSTPESLAIAKWSDGLVLDRVNRLRYHTNRATENRMSWTQAKSLALSGYSMPEILKTAYPSGLISLESLQSIVCDSNEEGARWISKQAARWKMRLNEEQGFEQPKSLKVCKAPQDGRQPRVFSDLNSQEIYVPKIKSSDDEISIVHEYLHIAFRNHPRGQDEEYIEKLARSLQE